MKHLDRKRIAAIVICAALGLSIALPAQAAPHHRGPDRNWHGHETRGYHDWHGHYGPPRGAIYAPPVVYAPPVEEAPGFNLTIPLHIR